VSDSLRDLFAEISAWQAETFPNATPASAVEHARREIVEELAPDPTNAEEQADIVFLMIDAARRSGNDLEAALRSKLAKNRARTWQKPDADGVVEHVR